MGLFPVTFSFLANERLYSTPPHSWIKPSSSIHLSIALRVRKIFQTAAQEKHKDSLRVDFIFRERLHLLAH